MVSADQQQMDAGADIICNIVDNRSEQMAAKKTGLAQKSSCSQQKLPSLGAFHSKQVDTVVTAATHIGQVISPMASAQHNTVVFNDINQPMAVDTPLFSGTALLLLRNMPNTPQGVFEGKRRQMVLTVQGRFKQPGVSFDSLVLGSDFIRPLKLPAGPLLSHAISWLAHKLGGGVSVNVAGKQPHIRAPLIAAAQVVQVALPGQQCDLLAPVEDMRLFDAGLVNRGTGHQLTAKQRRSHFGSGTNRKGRCYDTHHVWTFQAYEHIMDYSTFLLNMPFFKLDMVQLFDGQPLQLMMKDLASGGSMLHLTIWHRRMLQHPANKARTISGSRSTPAAADCDSHALEDDVAAQDDCGLHKEL